MKPWLAVRLALLVLLTAWILPAQVSQPAIIWQQTDPAGACAQNAPLRINIAVNPPNLWACNIPTLMWVQINTGSSGTGNPGGSSFSTQYNAGAGVFGGTGPGLSGQLYIAQGAGTQALYKTVSGDGTITNLGALTITASGGTAFGTAAFQNTGTSGGTLGLLNANLTFSGADIFSSSLTMTGLAPGTQISCLGLDSGNHIVLNTSACGSASGTVTSIGLVGTSNQITITGASPITGAGSWTVSIPTNPTLPGTTTGTFSGNLTGNVTGNVSGTAATITGLLALANTPLTTTQDILYTNGGVLARLPISTVTVGQCLGNNSGTWGTFACSGGGGTVTWQLAGSTVVSGSTFNDPGTGSGITHTMTNVAGVVNYSPSVNYSVVPSTACLQSGQPLYAHSTTGNTTFVATLVGVATCGNALTSYTTGMLVPLVTDTSTTTTGTLNIDGVNPITLKQHDCSTSIGADVIANQMDMLWYNGTFFCEINPPPGAGTGSVTSVSFTGGLISVANPTTTPALTVAMTSGGIVYGSSSSTWASSAVLTANLPVFGGGAGTAPFVGTVTGNTTKLATSTGGLTNGHCVDIDSNGNFIDSGAPCGPGSGGGGAGPQSVALPPGSGVQNILTIFQGPIAFTAKGQHIFTAAANSDLSGTVTVSNPATTGTLTFATPWIASPVCVITPTTNQLATILSFWVTASTTTLTVNTGSTPASAITFNYHCSGNPG